MHDLDELANASQSERQYQAKRRSARRYRAAMPAQSQRGPREARERTPFEWGLGIGLGIIVASLIVGFLFWLLALGGLAIIFGAKAISG